MLFARNVRLIFDTNVAALIILWSVVSIAQIAPPPVSSASPDDCEFIRVALANPQIKEIVIPQGKYICKQPVVVGRSNVKLVGNGQVILKLADHANCPLLILGNIETPPARIQDITVTNITLDGNRDLQDMECWGGPCDSGGVTNIRNNGITIRGVHGAEVTNVKVFRARSGGVVTEKDCSKLHIDGLEAKDNFFDGFAGYETVESLFENLDLSENLGAGISLDIRFHGNTFRNLKLNHNKDVGIFMRDSNGNTFVRTTIKDSGSHGVFISQVDNLANTGPMNNIFDNLIVEGAKGNGFHLNNPSCTGNQLVNPMFSNITGNHIFEAAPGVLKYAASRECKEYLIDDRKGVGMNAWDRNIRAYRERYRDSQMKLPY